MYTTRNIIRREIENMKMNWLKKTFDQSSWLEKKLQLVYAKSFLLFYFLEKKLWMLGIENFVQVMMEWII
jgi:hypothetical protein